MCTCGNVLYFCVLENNHESLLVGNLNDEWLEESLFNSGVLLHLRNFVKRLKVVQLRKNVMQPSLKSFQLECQHDQNVLRVRCVQKQFISFVCLHLTSIVNISRMRKSQNRRFRGKLKHTKFISNVFLHLRCFVKRLKIVQLGKNVSM